MKKLMKLLCMLMVACTLFGCGTVLNQEEKTIHLAGSVEGMEVDIVLECKGDRLLKETQKITTYASEYFVDDETLKKELYALKVSYEELECVSYDYSYEDDTLKETYVFDYSKPEYIETLVKEEFIELDDGSDKALFVTYESYVDSLIEDGLEIVE